MRKYIVFFCVTLFIFSGAMFVSARADTVLFFAPTRINIQDKKPVEELRVSNVSDISRSYTLTIENIAMNENGQTITVNNFDYSAKRMLRFVPHQFVLQPGEKQIVRIMSRFPEGTEDGEYHAHLQFLEDISKRGKPAEVDKDGTQIVAMNNQAKANAYISYSTAIPITISKGVVKTDVSMRDVKFGYDDVSGRPNVSLVLGRSGNGQGNVMIDADYIAPDGSEKKAGVRRSVYIYRELDHRNHSFILELVDKKDLEKGGKIRVRLYNKNISDQEPIDTVFVPI